MPVVVQSIWLSGPLKAAETRGTYNAIVSVLGDNSRPMPRRWFGKQQPWLNRNLPAQAQNHPDIAFGELGYAAGAHHAFRLFKAVRDTGEVADFVQFQGSLPSRVSVARKSIPTAMNTDELPEVEAALLPDLGRFFVEVSSRDLAIQLSVTVELLTLDKRLVRIQRPIRLCRARPDAAW